MAFFQSSPKQKGLNLLSWFFVGGVCGLQKKLSEVPIES